MKIRDRRSNSSFLPVLFYVLELVAVVIVMHIIHEIFGILVLSVLVGLYMLKGPTARFLRVRARVLLNKKLEEYDKKRYGG